MNTKLASSENASSRPLTTKSTLLDRGFDRDFNEMVQFGLHDEHDIRSIMDLPAHTLDTRYDG